MHVRKLVPLAELFAQGGGGEGRAGGGRPAPTRRSTGTAGPVASRRASASAVPPADRRALPIRTEDRSSASGALKDKLLAEIRAEKAFFYNTVVAQAQKIEVGDDRVVFTFLPAHRALREQFDQTKDWLKELATRVAGRLVTVSAAQAEAPGDDAPPAAKGTVNDASSSTRDLKAEAMASSTVQAVVKVFRAEIRNVEEV
jgi:hypothetical protein